MLTTKPVVGVIIRIIIIIHTFKFSFSIHLIKVNRSSFRCESTVHDSYKFELSVIDDNDRVNFTWCLRGWWIYYVSVWWIYVPVGLLCMRIYVYEGDWTKWYGWNAIDFNFMFIFGNLQILYHVSWYLISNVFKVWGGYNWLWSCFEVGSSFCFSLCQPWSYLLEKQQEYC